MTDSIDYIRKIDQNLASAMTIIRGEIREILVLFDKFIEEGLTQKSLLNVQVQTLDTYEIMHSIWLRSFGNTKIENIKENDLEECKLKINHMYRKMYDMLSGEGKNTSYKEKIDGASNHTTH